MEYAVSVTDVEQAKEVESSGLEVMGRVERFGKCGYRGGNDQEYSAAFYNYWRSTMVIHRLVEHYFDRSLEKLIDSYQSWVTHRPFEYLHVYFVKHLGLTEKEAKELWFL